MTKIVSQRSTANFKLKLDILHRLCLLRHPSRVTAFFLGTMPSNYIFAKTQIGSIVFLITYKKLVTGNSSSIYWLTRRMATKPPMKFGKYIYFE